MGTGCGSCPGGGHVVGSGVGGVTGGACCGVVLKYI